jgi:cell division protein FtsW
MCRYKEMLKKLETTHLSLLIELPILILMGLGTVFVFSAGANVTSNFDLQNFYEFTTRKQLLFFPLAVALMYVMACIDAKRFSLTRAGALKSFAPYLLILSAILLVLALIPGIGAPTHSSWRWLELRLGSTRISFQPSELAKWAVVIYMAAILDRFAGDLKQYWKRFIPICIPPVIVIGLIISQDFGTAAFISGLTFLMLIIGGATWWHFLTPLPAVGVIFYFAIAKVPYRMARIQAWFDSEAESTATYHAVQSLIAVSTGGMWGKGLGRGVSKYGHLPEDTTDFIFAIIAEELGFVGSISVILLFSLLILISLVVVNRSRDRFCKLLAAGIAMTIGLQAAINIGVVTTVLPTKGIPLPFLSAGGTSLLLTAAASGILINIARQTEDITVLDDLYPAMEETDGSVAAV